MPLIALDLGNAYDTIENLPRPRVVPWYLSLLSRDVYISPRKISEINKEQSKKTQKRAELKGRLHGMKDQASCS